MPLLWIQSLEKGSTNSRGEKSKSRLIGLIRQFNHRYLPRSVYKKIKKCLRKIEMEFKTEFELEDDAEIVKTVYESIQEENMIEENALEEDKRRSLVDISLNGNKLCVRIDGDDLIRVRAATNTWLRLVKVAEEMTRVVKECDPHGF